MNVKALQMEHKFYIYFLEMIKSDQFKCDYNKIYLYVKFHAET